MVVNIASKYSDLVDERFTQASLTESAFSNTYDFTGVDSVTVYSVNTVPMRDYSMTGTQRFGTAEELGDTVQTLIMKKDRAFNFTIDERHYVDTMMVREVGRAFRRQLDEVLIPEIDQYRLGVLATEAGNTGTGAVTRDNAYEYFIDGVTTILGNKAPLSGAVAYISSAFYKYIRLDQTFIRSGDLSQQMLLNGQIGTVEGVPLILVPFGYLPDGVEFLITNRIASVSPRKIDQVNVHKNPPGIGGWLVEGRTYYDAFVLNNKRNAIYTHVGAGAPEALKGKK